MLFVMLMCIYTLFGMYFSSCCLWWQSQKLYESDVVFDSSFDHVVSHLHQYFSLCCYHTLACGGGPLLVTP